MSPLRISTLTYLALFAITSLLVVTGTTDTFDHELLLAAGAARTGTGISVMQSISTLGNWRVEVPLIFAITGSLWLRGRATSAWRYFAVCLSGEFLYALAKLVSRRPRPTVITHLTDGGWYSYPSGHSLLAPVIWGAGLLLVAQLTESRAIKVIHWGLAIAIIAAIGVSRVYLGVHYPTDVIGGVTLGMAWVTLWWNAVKDGSRG